MRILFLTQILPYPPDAGPKVKTWNVLRYLAARGYQITLVTFIRPEEMEYVPFVEEICEAVYTVPIHRSTLANIRFWLQSRFTGRPFLIERDNLRSMHKVVQDLVNRENFDSLHADQLTMTQFPLSVKRGDQHERQQSKLNEGAYAKETRAQGSFPRLVFDAHNAIWITIERMNLNAPWFLRPILADEVHRLKKYTGRVVKAFDFTFTVTETDRESLMAEAKALSPNGQPKINPITVIPIAVDTEELAPIHPVPGLTNILTLGSLHYPPNADGIRWFATEVFPLICARFPEATLTIVGKNPPEDLVHLAAGSDGSIDVTGYVPDLQPYYEKAAVVVVPVRAGGGMRVRILEAFALAMPVVTTTIGIEGIDARPGEDYMLGDTPAEFSEAVVKLLTDEGLRARLSDNGRRLAETKYDWLVVLNKVDQLYDSLAHSG